MPDISRITLPSGTTYDIKDEVARQMAAAGVSFTISTDAASTPQGVTWDDHGTTITGTLVASVSTKGVFYLVPVTTQSGKDIYAEYVTIKLPANAHDEYGWEKIGTTDIDLSDLGDLAYKDTVSVNVKPEGTVSKPTFTGNSMTSTGVGTYVGVDGIRNYKDANTYVNIQNGVITAKAVNLTGEITAISGIIGGASIVDGVLQVTDANISGEISANHINASGLTIAQSQVTNLTTDLNSKASTTSVNNLKAVYGTSSTAGATATKVVTCSNFALYTGALITVRFSAANTVDGLKLNVNGTGAKLEAIVIVISIFPIEKNSLIPLKNSCNPKVIKE